MRLGDYTKEELQILVEWGESPSYKVLAKMIEDRQKRDSSRISESTGLSEWDFVSTALSRTKETSGMRRLLKLPNLAKKYLQNVKK